MPRPLPGAALARRPVNYGREDARRNVSAADYAQNLETLRDMLLAGRRGSSRGRRSVPRGVPDVRRLDAAAERVFARNASFDDLSAVLDTNCRLENGSGYPETAGCPRLQRGGDGTLKPRGAFLLGLHAAASTLAISAAAAEINDVHDEAGRRRRRRRGRPNGPSSGYRTRRVCSSSASRARSRSSGGGGSAGGRRRRGAPGTVTSGKLATHARRRVRPKKRARA